MVRAVDTTTGEVVSQVLTGFDGRFTLPVPDSLRGLSFSAQKGSNIAAVKIFKPGTPLVVDLEALSTDTLQLPTWSGWTVDSLRPEGLDLSGRLLNDSTWIVSIPSNGDLRLVVYIHNAKGLSMTVRISLRRTSDAVVPVVPTTGSATTLGLRALWTFDAWTGESFASSVATAPSLKGSPTELVAGSQGKALVPSKGTHPSTADNSIFAAGTGGVTYIARVYLDAYPSDALHNARAVVLGQYDGFRILVTHDGRIQIGGQRGDGSSWSWYAPQSRPGVVPLKQWVELGLGADPRSGEFYGYVDGQPVQLFTGSAVDGKLLRDGTYPFVVGGDAVDGQEFPGLIDEVRIVDGLPLGAGPAVRVGSGSDLYFPLGSETVAQWGFDFWSNGRVIDETGHGFDILGDKTGLVASPFGEAWNGAVSSYLSGGVTPDLGLTGSGKVRYEARVELDALPSSSLHNGRAVVMGFYAGPKLLVTSDGRIQGAVQRGDGSSWSWYAPQSAAGAVPTGRWVTLAVEADPATAGVRAWVDGTEVTLTSSAVAGTLLRPSFGEFRVGADPVDGQDFPGLIDEARILRLP